MIKIDTSGPTPFILINSNPVRSEEGIKAILNFKDWNRHDMAHYLKVSCRTIDGWLNGRKPSNVALIALSYMLD